MLNPNAVIDRAVDQAIKISGDAEITIFLHSGGTIKCMATPMYAGVKPSGDSGNERMVNELVLEIAKAQYPDVTANGDKIRFPGKWVRKDDAWVTWRVGGFAGDQTAPGSWLLKMSAA